MCLFFKRKKENEDLWVPELANEEILQIQYEQAKLIYENAKDVLRDNLESDKSLKTKADNIFKYLILIQSSLLGLFFIKYDNPNFKLILNNADLSIILMLIFVPCLIYIYVFQAGSNYLGVDNPPCNTIRKKALEKIELFYIVEAIDIQKFAIPFNMKMIIKKARWLKCMSLLSILSILFTFFTIVGRGSIGSIISYIAKFFGC